MRGFIADLLGASHKRLSILIVACTAGIFLRIWYCASSSSLFLDECALSLNLVRPYSKLSQMLDYNQAAPLGFLYLLKAVIRPFGSTEAMLRALPLLFSILTIPAFYLLTKRIFSNWPLVAANVLFCFNQVAIAYSAQVKQYSLELLVSTIMLLLSVALFDPARGQRAFCTSALVLGLLLWFSFSGVFVLAGIGLAFLVSQMWDHGGRGVQRSVSVLSLWALLFIPVYFFSIRPGSANSALHDGWEQDYFPLRHLTQAPYWVSQKLLEISTLSFNKRLSALGVVLLMFGLIAAVLRRNWLLLAGAGGMLACFGAALLQKYPFGGRLILFLVPAVILLMTSGYQWLSAITQSQGSVVLALNVVAALILIWCSASAIRAYGIHPTFIDKPKQVLEFVRDNWQPGDRLYVTPLSTPCVVYYERSFHWPRVGLSLNVFAVDGAEHAPTNLSVPVPHGRAWLVVMRTEWLKRGESVPVEEYFDARGKQIQRTDSEWTSAILYDMR